MKISEIYSKYSTPPNLQNHLLLVAQVAMLIANHWKAKNLDTHLLLKAALLHDLANIVKFDFLKHPEFLGTEQSRINYWISKQKEVMEKYGNDDHEATIKMLDEIGVDSKVKADILVKSFANAIEVNNSSNLVAKILLYADMRVGPFGIVTLQERLADITTRLEKYKNNPNLPQLVASVEQIQFYIQENVDIDLGNILESSFELSNEELLQTNI